MRIKMLKSAATAYGTFQVGQGVNIPDDVAEAWLKSGLAMGDNPLELTKTKKTKRRKKGLTAPPKHRMVVSAPNTK